ncbi:MAG: hypothetical protein WA913_01420 [Pricia sp.]
MKTIKLSSALIAMLLLTACPGSKEDDPGDPTFPGKGGNVAAVNLVFPENDSECTEVTDQGNGQAMITFRWEATETADNYEVNLTNIDTGGVQKTDSETNEAEVILSANTPYEWFVISRKEGSDQASESEKWKFYAAGAGTKNYAPFPAEVVSPQPGSVLTGTAVTLEWTGSDVDNDIVEFEVLLDSDSPPQQSLDTTAQSGLNLTIDTAGTYYWQVLTVDSAGNRSRSEVFGFTVQ